MKALVLHGLKDLRLDDVPEPVAHPGSVIISVIASPVWDYLPEIVDGRRIYPLNFPFTFGTYAVGRIKEVGPDVSSLKPGQLVFCDCMIYLRDEPTNFLVLGYHGGYNAEERKVSSSYWKDGCFAEFARFPAENVHAIDEKLLAKQNTSIHQLAEVASVGPAMGAANSINIKAGETVLVIPSTGFFSSNAITAALGLGANVVAGGRNKESLDRLVKYFDNTKRITPVVLSGDADRDTASIRAATPHGKGADAYIDFSPPVAANNTHIMAGLKALKRNGRCCFAGVILENVKLPYYYIMDNGLTITGAFACRREDTAQTIRLIEVGNLKLRKNILGPFPIDDFSNTMKLAGESKGWDKMVLFGSGK